MRHAAVEKPIVKEKLALSSSLIASILASLCCIAPLVTVALGLGSFGLSSFFETLRPYLLVATALLLGTAFYFTYRKTAVVCENEVCKRERVGRFNKVMLWTVTGLVILFATFPYYSGLFAPRSPQPNAVNAQTTPKPTNNISEVVIKIEGMTCVGCIANVESTLKQQAGVKSVAVTFEPGQAIVSYDPSKVTSAQLVKAINALGYKANL